MKVIDMGKRGMTVVLTLIIILSSFSFVSAATFSDIPKNHWAINEIEYLAQKRLIQGVGDGTYIPNESITRAQFVRIINSALELTNQLETGNAEFKDVSKGAWYYEDVAKAIKNGYVTGHSDGTFAPNEPVTREQAATMIVKAFELGKSTKNTNFLDKNKISSWAREFVNVVSEKGYIVGLPNGNFQPDLNVTRAQSASIIYRLLTGDVAEVPEPPKPAPAPVAPKGEQIAATARKYLGHKYVYGGASPSGFDCSGFTYYVYKQFGVSLPRTSGAQRSAGKSVSRDNIRPGDLLTFSGHVGIYVGDGVMVHAANPSRGVVTDNVFSGYYSGRILSIRRLVD